MDMVIVVPILLLLLLLVPLAAAQWQSCGDSGTYASNSTYQTNLGLLSSILPKKVVSNTTLFATGTVGQAPDIVYALALCRGDTTDASHCETCAATAFHDAQQLCPYRDTSRIRTGLLPLDLEPIRRPSRWIDIRDRGNPSPVVSGKLPNSEDSIVSAHLQTPFRRRRRPPAPCARLHSQDSKYSPSVLYGMASRSVAQSSVARSGTSSGSTAADDSEENQYTNPKYLLWVHVTRYNVGGESGRGGNSRSETEWKNSGRNSGKRGLWIISVVAPLLSILLCLICSLLWMRRRRKGPLTNKLDQWEDQVALVLIVDTEVNSKVCNEEALLAKRSKKGAKEKDLHFTNHLKRGRGVRDDRACAHGHDPGSTACPDRLPSAPAEPPPPR